MAGEPAWQVLAWAVPVTASGPPTADPARPGDEVPSADAAAGLVLDQKFDTVTLQVLRKAVLAHAVHAGMPAGRAVDVVIALQELACPLARADSTSL